MILSSRAKGGAVALVAAVFAAACQTTGSEPEPERRGLAPLPRVERTVTEGRWPEPAPGAPARVLLVSIAGLTPDRYAPGGEGMPVLSDLAARGVAAEALVPIRPDTPFPVHATLVTGQPPSEHGIVADRLIGDRGVRAVHYWHASRLTAPTLWERARDEDLQVAALGWPSTVGADIDFLLPDLDATRPGDTWLDLQRQTASPRLYMAARESAPPEASNPGTAWPDRAQRDTLVADAACRLVLGESPPRLWLIRLTGPEPVLREQGPRRAEVAAAFRAADGELGRILDCFAQADLLGSSAVFVVGDRAILPVHTAVEPNQRLAAEGLVTVSPEEGGIESWSALSRSNGGSAFVYAADAETAVEAKRVLSEFAARTRAFRVVPATELQAYRADPQAWFGLEAARGFAFGDAVEGPPIHAAADRGASGYLRPDRVAAAGLAAWGQGLRRRLTAPELYMEDVAPTVSALLGLSLGIVDGRVMVGLIESRSDGEPRGGRAP